MLSDLQSYYGTTWSDDRETQHAEVLLPFSEEDIASGIDLCKKDAEIRFMPLAAQIVEKCRNMPKERIFEEEKNNDDYQPMVLTDFIKKYAGKKYPRPKCQTCDDFGYITMLRRETYEYNYRCVCPLGKEYEKNYPIIDPLLGPPEWSKQKRMIEYLDEAPKRLTENDWIKLTAKSSDQ